MSRDLLAYLLIVLLLLGAAGVVAYLRYHSREPVPARDRRKEREALVRLAKGS